MNTVQSLVKTMAQAAAQAAGEIARTSGQVKNAVLLRTAERILASREHLQSENAKDIQAAKHKDISTASLHRLTLSDAVIQSMARGLQELAALPDPVGAIPGMWRRPNGLTVGRVRIPLGVVGMIYESRPNVTIDAAALCFKSGNAVILKGGSEALHSNLALAGLFQTSLAEFGLPEAAIQLIGVTDREVVSELLKQEDTLDVIIPRGGEDLIRFVVQHSRIPVLKHDKGVCHAFVDQGADLDMARTVCLNSKVQRPGVCNALEGLLIHQEAAGAFLPALAADFQEHGVEIRGCPRTCSILPQASPAEAGDWGREFLDLILAVRVVDGLDQALEHIRCCGSRHTELICSNDYSRINRFLREVDASLVLVNASTRFNDGGQLGLGAEIGISTSKLHAYGPMGLEELTSSKFIAHGQGQIRND